MNAKEIFNTLDVLFPNACCELNYSNEYELIVAVILSAQCTDKRVNAVMPHFLNAYPNFKSLSVANPCEVEMIINPCGLASAKAKNLVQMAGRAQNYYGGKVPKSMVDLMSLDGVGRKTANVVRAVIFNEPAIPVDTHVFRTSHRLGLSQSNNLKVCEEELMSKFDSTDWIRLHYLLVFFGRYMCKAQSPLCNKCPFSQICDHTKK